MTDSIAQNAGARTAGGRNAQTGAAGPDPEATARFAAEWRRWHARHESARAAEHGFLAITGIHWLRREPERFDDAPGRWSTGDDGPIVELADGETLRLDGRTVTGVHRFGPLAERSSLLATWQDGDERAAVEVARRGGNDIVRPGTPGTASASRTPEPPRTRPTRGSWCRAASSPTARTPPRPTRPAHRMR